jgi:hypothetical protein
MSLHDLIILNEKIEELEKQNEIMRSALEVTIKRLINRGFNEEASIISSMKEALSQSEEL